MPTKHSELRQYVSETAVIRGEFKLASGLTSDYYIDGKLIFAQPRGLKLVAAAVLDELAGLAVGAIGGLEIGAIYIATAVSLASIDRPKPIRLFTVRKEAKGHGTKRKIEGYLPPDHGMVAVVDDVVTTGGSVVQAIEAVRAEGREVAVAITIVDRASGAAEALERLQVPYRPLLTIADLGLTNDHTRRENLQRAAS